MCRPLCGHRHRRSGRMPESRPADTSVMTTPPDPVRRTADDPPEEPPEQSRPPASSTPPTRKELPVLAGREHELRRIELLLETAGREGGGVLMLYGEPGIGKTALLTAAVHEAEIQAFHVLLATGTPSEGPMPYQGLHRLLRPVLPQADRLPPAQRAALFTALGLQDGAPPDPFLVSLAALDLFTEIATSEPVFVAIDDLHWFDQPSVEVVGFIARRLTFDPIAMLLTARTVIGEWQPQIDVTTLELSGLDEQSARRILDAAPGHLDETAIVRILDLSHGNPLALVELATAWQASPDRVNYTFTTSVPLTDRLENAFAGQIVKLPTVTQDAVLVAAVNSTDDLSEILAAAQLLVGSEITVSDLAAAAQVGLLRLERTRVIFRHPLVRTAVVRGRPPSRVLAAHAALAECLRADPHRRAWHQAHSVEGPDDRIAAKLEATHRVALRRGSALSAVNALERAAQLSSNPIDRSRRLLLAAEHGFGLGRADLVRRLLAEASTQVLSELDRVRMTWLEDIFHDGCPGDPERVLQLCDAARRAAQAGDVSLALNLLLAAALRCWWDDTGPQARSRVVDAVYRLDDVVHDPRYVAAVAVADPVRQTRPVSIVLARTMSESATGADGDTLRLVGMAAHAVGSSLTAADALDRAETLLRAHGRLGLLSHALGMQIQVRLELGDWQRAAEAATEGYRLAIDTGQPIWSTGTLVGEAKVAALRGEAERAHLLLAAVEEQLRGHRLSDLLACVQLVRGILHLISRQYELAFDGLAALFDPAAPCRHERESFGAVGFLAEAAHHAGRQEKALDLLAAITRTEAADASPLLRIQLHYAGAVLSADDLAEAAFAESLAQDLSRWPWPRARLELAYGSWLRRRRRTTESRAPLRAALATFEAIGAYPWADATRAELRASGEIVAGTSNQSPLSAQELQTAGLAAQGLTNRQIGEILFLSPRTVAAQLYRIYPKLGVT
ncbi:MAG: ATP-binding protein, partial [Pseudonocardiaceae bacterium]